MKKINEKINEKYTEEFMGIHTDRIHEQPGELGVSEGGVTDPITEGLDDHA